MDMSICADCGSTTPWLMIALACITATACFVVARKLAKRRSPLGRGARAGGGRLSCVACHRAECTAAVAEDPP
jgi:hypothetical protein